MGNYCGDNCCGRYHICRSMVLFPRWFVRMAEKVEDAIDAIIDGRELKTEELNKDTLFSKIQSKLEQLSEVTKSAEEKNVKQKEEMQKWYQISPIS